MKKLFFLLFTTLAFQTNAQWDTKEPLQFQRELDYWYTNPESSPFKGEMLEKFAGLNYFPVNDEFIIEATFKKKEKKKERVFGTSSGKTRKMVEYGTLTFVLQGETYNLIVLKNEHREDPDFADYLTVAFTDLTSGIETYGGGRYLGLREHELEDGKVTLNFNLAYHPYCAYTDGYSCLIPPRKNRITKRIAAGIQMGYQTK